MTKRTFFEEVFLSEKTVQASIFLILAFTGVSTLWGQPAGFARSGGAMTSDRSAQAGQKQQVHMILSDLSENSLPSSAFFVEDQSSSLTPVAGTVSEQNHSTPVPVTPFALKSAETERPGMLVRSILNDMATPERTSSTNNPRSNISQKQKSSAHTHHVKSTPQTESPSFFSGLLKQKEGTEPSANTSDRRPFLKRRPLGELLRDDSPEPKQVKAAKPVPPQHTPNPAAVTKMAEKPALETVDVPLVLDTQDDLSNIAEVREGEDLILGSLDEAEKQPEALVSKENAGADSADKSSPLRDLDATGTESADAKQETAFEFRSPVIEIKASNPKRLMVGQESEYEIRVENAGNLEAKELCIQTQIPEGIEIVGIQPTGGTSRISENSASGGPLLCIWNVGTLTPDQKEGLTLRFIPRIRTNIDFVSHYDFEKSAIRSGIEIQEPILEMTIEGRDTIDWGVEDKYRMLIRNTGNGDAENIRLTVTTGENDSANRVLPSLKPGEEKTMEINIKTVLDGSITVKAQAAADYGFNASASKTIGILRGHLDIFVEAPEMQFVNETVDYLVHVSNTGSAILQNVEVAATIPPTVEYLSSSGDARLDESAGRLIWSIAMIKPDEEFVYQVTGKMLRAGSCRMDITAADKTGVSSTGEALVQVEAIAALEMKINKPSGPIALGSEVEYEVVISNNGTKAAEEIDAGFFLPDGMVPRSVEGGGMIMENESKVLFSKINFLGPGQSVVYKVRAEANRAGNHKVQAVLESRLEEIQLVSEEMNYFYQRRTVAKRGGLSADRVAMKAASPASPPSATVLETPTLPAEKAPEPSVPLSAKPAEPVSSAAAENLTPFPSLPLALPGPSPEKE